MNIPLYHMNWTYERIREALLVILKSNGLEEVIPTEGYPEDAEARWIDAQLDSLQALAREDNKSISTGNGREGEQWMGIWDNTEPSSPHDQWVN